MGHIGEHVTLDEPAFIHESAWLYGKVYVGPRFYLAECGDPSGDV